MATNLTDTTFLSTYKDDFKDSDNYHRILFNSGKAVQARELTQLQTIINKEIQRFGSNVFKDGGVVEPGGITVNNKMEFIKLAAGQLPNNPLTAVVGQTFTVKAPDPALEVKVIKLVQATGSDPDTLYVEYVSTQAGTSGSDPVRVGNGQVLQLGGLEMTTAASGAAGRGTEASIAKGIFFVQGHFVFAEKQSFFVDKYSDTPNIDVGFRVDETVVTVNDDVALYDNQGATPNVAAPGADRYRIRLTLTRRDLVSSSENFIYLAKLTNGKISDEARTDNSYSTVNDLLALRTKEESGNYIVKPFDAKYNIFDSANSSNLQLEVTDGIVYVDGYRLEASSKNITVPKSSTTLEQAGQIVVSSYGNFVKGDVDDNKGLPNTDTFAKLNLRSAINHGGSTIGTCRVRHIEEDGNKSFRFYLFDIRMNSGQNFSSSRSFGTSTSDYVNITLEGGVAVLKNTSQNDLLFPLPRTRPKEDAVAFGSLQVQKRITFTTSGSGAATLSRPNQPDGTQYDAFTNTSQWIFTKATGEVDSSMSISLGGGGVNATVSGGAPSTNYIGYVLVNETNPNAKDKTLEEATITKTFPGDAESDGRGSQFISLRKADIFDVKSIKITDSDGADIKSLFTVDNGQRDNFYGIGRIVKKPNVTIPTGTQIFSRFQYFSHSTEGHFFDITSYDNANIAYGKIPSHQKADGTLVSLRDVVDFRPVADRDSSADRIPNITFDSGVGASVNPLPQNTGTFQGTISYYLPRKDRLIATTLNPAGERLPRGEVKVIQGVPALDPLLPEVPAGAMPLYNFTLKPNTLNESDMTSEFVPAKRFTMADIAELEQRIDKLQETTLLSLLEVDTANLTVLDSAGLERTKAGFLVDNFKDAAFSDIRREEYRAAIDESLGHLVPLSNARNVRLIYDSDASTTERRGDIATLPIVSEIAMIDQNLATETENINPFAVIVSQGHLEMSPTSDEWVETEYAPDNVVDTGETETERLATRWIARIRQTVHSFRNRWIGTPSGGRVLVRGDVRTRREIVADRIIDVSFIPFMRARKIFFKVNGLRRKTKHFMFFGGKDITAFARPETTFQRFATRDDNPGNIFTNATAHPDGTGDLLSDSVGELIGSFVIPANEQLKFRTGAQRVELMDISSGISNNAVSKAQATFQSTGILNTRQRTVETTRIETEFFVQEYDPLAQSFRVDGADNPNGLFITKVDVFFSSKETSGGVPVQCQLRTMENGIPTSAPIPGAVKFLRPDQVNIPADLTSMTSIRNTPTAFVFDEPIYLEPQRDYAIVLLADTTAYNVHVARTYDFLIGSTERRVNKQATLGSMFLSQNGITWTPDQNRDLMFKLHRAQFSSSTASVQSFNSEPPLERLRFNPISVDSGSSTVRIFHEGHGFAKNDKVTISGLDSAQRYGGILGTSLMGVRTIVKPDHTGYTFAADSAGTSTGTFGARNVVASQNTMYDVFVPQVQTLVPDNTSVDAQFKGRAGTSFGDTRTTGGGSYSGDTVYKTITLNDFNFNESPKVVGSKTNEAAFAGSVADLGTKSANLKLNLSTDDVKVSPIIDLQRNSMAAFEFSIDGGGAANTNTIDQISETDPTDGSAAAKHVTVPVTLEETAVGLKIMFAANRPSTSNFEVYVKTTTDDDLDEIPYIQTSTADLITNNPADEDGTTFRQYEYLVGGQGGELDGFTKFQVKIVLTSSNSSKPPTIKDLRVIALVT